MWHARCRDTKGARHDPCFKGLHSSRKDIQQQNWLMLTAWSVKILDLPFNFTTADSKVEI